MICERCGSIMTDISSFHPESYLCIFCGNVVYPAFPKRIPKGNNCDICGDEYEKKHLESNLCPECRKLSNSVKRHFEKGPIEQKQFERALPWSDKKKMEVSI